MDHRRCLAIILGVLLLLAAGCRQAGSGAASFAIGEKGVPGGTGSDLRLSGLDPARAILATSPLLVEYDLRQQMPLDSQSVERYYQRFPGAARVLAEFGWQAGAVHTYVRRSAEQVPATVTVEVHRFASGQGASRFLDSLRRNGSPSLHHFLDLADQPRLVDRPKTGDESVAFEASLHHRGVVPEVVPVRYYAFRRGPFIVQILVVRNGPNWAEILRLAQEQDTRLTTS